VIKVGRAPGGVFEEMITADKDLTTVTLGE
jgi:hypothetical protein